MKISWSADLDLEDIEDQRDLKELSGEGNIENMLFVEQGLRQLASLKVSFISFNSNSNDNRHTEICFSLLNTEL